MNNSEAVELKAKIVDLETENTKLTETVEVLTRQLAKVGALGDLEKERLLEYILKAHPNCYNQIEFDEAFKEATAPAEIDFSKYRNKNDEFLKK